MTEKLPPPLAAYFAGVNAHAFEAALAAFADDAIVKDEGRERRGVAAIREWIAETTEKYHPTIAVASIAETGGDTIVTGVVSGDFPGSPAELRFTFRLAGERIHRLEIS